LIRPKTQQRKHSGVNLQIGLRERFWTRLRFGDPNEVCRASEAAKLPPPPMSKIREQFDAPPPTPLAVSPTGDLRPYVIFTQLKKGGPHIYAGWLEASDDAMAMSFAKEHYGQDQECVGIWAIRREHLTSSDGLYPPLPVGDGPGVRAATQQGAASNLRTPSPQPSPEGRGSFVAFTQKKAGDLFLEAGAIDADSPQRAIELARRSNRMAQNAHCIWAVAKPHILATAEGEVIWRYTDQSYRLARGYGREVRAKWIAFRDESKLAEYEKDDLAEAF
jgi:ring-1,2-phenylacetyl-CoA epoxidase subunit PaaB